MGKKAYDPRDLYPTFPDSSLTQAVQRYWDALLPFARIGTKSYSTEFRSLDEIDRAAVAGYRMLKKEVMGYFGATTVKTVDDVVKILLGLGAVETKEDAELLVPSLFTHKMMYNTTRRLVAHSTIMGDGRKAVEFSIYVAEDMGKHRDFE